jgi:membrane fusion protein
LRAIDAQVTQRMIEASRGGSEVAAQRAALAEQRAALLRTDQLTLTAPVAGEVGDIGGEVGQRARPETSLVTIVPRGSRLEVWLYAPSRSIGFVTPGQEVRLLFDAFPYEKYGAGSGTVTSLSRGSDRPRSDRRCARYRGAGLQDPSRIDEAPARVTDAQGRLRPGMTLTANLIRERRSLWEVIFNPIKSALST